MRIAQVSPLIEAVPPKLYGGTERVVSYLTEELVALGHNVTLFASGDSKTTAKLVSAWPKALRLDPEVRDPLAPHIAMIETLLRRIDDFDIVHLHIDHLAFPAIQRAGVPFLATLHGRLDLPELRGVFRLYDEIPVVSISDAQRAPLPEANFVATVHHGLPPNVLRPGRGEGGYLAFLGRLSPEKGPGIAIRIAAAAGLELHIAAKIDRANAEYFEAEIKPLLGQSHVRFVGEIDEHGKSSFLGNARALLFPIQWPEPFGLAMIEAMACGTPVIAYPGGSVPEIIDDGVTGFIVETEAEAARAVARVGELDRARIRRVFEERFSARRMTEDYLQIYRGLIAQARPLREAV